MKELANIYYIFKEPVFVVVRILLIVFFILNSLLFYLNDLPYNLYVFSASILLIFEIFLEFKVAKISPRVEVSKDNNDPLDSFDIKTLSIFQNLNSRSLLAALFKQKEVKFILMKANISPREIPVGVLDKITLAQKAANMAMKSDGKFVISSDIVASYLLLYCEKLLVEKDLKEADLINILKWQKLHFSQYDKKDLIVGRGFADDWVFGWIRETKQCMYDLTEKVLSKKRFFYPREAEYKGMISYLANRKSVLLVGDPGSGKEALVEELVKDSYEGKLSGPMKNTRVYQFLVDAFLAGKSTQGDLQERFVMIMEELSHQKEIIIFIENIESILGSQQFNLDLSASLIPYLRDSHLRIVGSTSPQAFKKFVLSKPSFLDAIVSIKVASPNNSEMISILLEKSFEIEQKYGVLITYKAIVRAIELGPKFAPTISLPGSSVNLLEEVSSGTNSIDKVIDVSSLEQAVEEKTNIKISKPKVSEARKLLSLESEIHKFIVGQNEAVSAVSEGMRRIRSGLESQARPVSFLFLGPTGVGKTETAKVLSNIYFGGEKKIIRVDMSEFSDENALSKILSSDATSFLDQVFNNPFCLILLDEFEKASPKVQNLFLQVLDDGRLTDASNKTISFQNSLIIATSNAGTEFIRENMGKENSLPKDSSKKLIDHLLRKDIFKPELINRFDAVVVFKPLSSSEILKVSSLIIGELKKSLENQEIFASFDPSVAQKVAKEGFDSEFGARPLRRFVQNFIEDPLAKKILEGEIKKGEKISISVSDLGELQIIPH